MEAKIQNAWVPPHTASPCRRAWTNRGMVLHFRQRVVPSSRISSSGSTRPWSQACSTAPKLSKVSSPSWFLTRYFIPAGTLCQFRSDLRGNPKAVDRRRDDAAGVPAPLARRVETCHRNRLKIVTSGHPYRRAGAALNANENRVLAYKPTHLAIETPEGCLERCGQVRGVDPVQVGVHQARPVSRGAGFLAQLAGKVVRNRLSGRIVTPLSQLVRLLLPVPLKLEAGQSSVKTRLFEVLHRDGHHDARVGELGVAPRVAHAVGALEAFLGGRGDDDSARTHAKRVNPPKLAPHLEVLGQLVVRGRKLGVVGGTPVLNPVHQLLRVLGAKADRERLGLQAHPAVRGESLEQLAGGVSRCEDHPIGFEHRAVAEPDPRCPRAVRQDVLDPRFEVDPATALGQLLAKLFHRAWQQVRAD